MSDAIYEQISSGMVALNDALRGAFSPDGARMFMLGRKGPTQRFGFVHELTVGYYVEWSEWRQQMKFQIAGTDTDFVDLVFQMSYMGYGVPNSNNKIDVFEVSLNQADRVPPNGDSPFWKFYGIRKPEIRFLIEEP
jgi:hypothetical protein